MKAFMTIVQIISNICGAVTQTEPKDKMGKIGQIRPNQLDK
jgi:hypothetical protein